MGDREPMIGAEAEEIRERADEILSRPEYRPAEPGLVERVFQWLDEQFGDLLGVAVGQGRGYWIGYGILALALIAVGYLLWRVFPRGLARRSTIGPVVEHTTESRLSRAQWLRRAGDAEERDRWDEAVHARYHALTTGLADRDRLPPEASVTSGEHRDHFAMVAPPGQTEVFSEAIDRFEQVWFGGSPADPADSWALAEADRRLLEQGS